MKAALKPENTPATSLQMNTFIKAPAARVFKALTTPEQINQWFAPDLSAMTPKIDAKIEVGGAYKLVMTKTDGSTHGAFGKYLEIVPNKKLSFSWGWDAASCDGETREARQDESIVTFELKEKEGGTEVTLTHERLPDAVSVERHTEGWEGCLGNLAVYASAH
jgi:uncharacterized protein YndB with AHSA1/START domain